jgi:hypothetical protein
MRASINVVVSNCASLIDLPKACLQQVYYSSSVGGSMPLLPFVTNAERSGDRVTKVQRSEQSTVQQTAQTTAALASEHWRR